MKRRNVFAGPYVDRAAHLRQDAAWFASALADAGSRVVPVWNSRSFIAQGETPRAAFPTLSEIADWRPDPDALVLLGRVDQTNFFAYEIEGIDPPQLAGGARFEDLRLVASLLPPDEAGLLGYARAMISWRPRHHRSRERRRARAARAAGILAGRPLFHHRGLRGARGIAGGCGGARSIRG